MSEKPIYRNALRSKRYIKNALVSLLSEKDIAKIKIKEIIECADISKGTFYAHYTDVYDILNEIEQEQISFLLNFLNTQVTNEIFNDFLPFIKAMFVEMKSNHAYFEQIFVSPYFDHMFTKVQNAIVAHVLENKEKYPQIHLGKDSRMFLTYTLSGAVQVIRAWYMKEYSCTFEELAEKLNSFLMSGIKSILIENN